MAQQFRDSNLAITAEMREMKKQQAGQTNEIDSLKKSKAELQEKSVCLAYKLRAKFAE